MHCRHQIDAAAELAAASTCKKKKGRRAGGVKQRAQSRDKAEAESLLQDALPAEMLVALLKNAPTTHVCTEPCMLVGSSALQCGLISCMSHHTVLNQVASKI